MGTNHVSRHTSAPASSLFFSLVLQVTERFAPVFTLLWADTVEGVTVTSDTDIIVNGRTIQTRRKGVSLPHMVCSLAATPSSQVLLVMKWPCDVPTDTPSQRVQVILSAEDRDEDHIPHNLFTELDELALGDGDFQDWKETARWRLPSSCFNPPQTHIYCGMLFSEHHFPFILAFGAVKQFIIQFRFHSLFFCNIQFVLELCTCP